MMRVNHLFQGPEITVSRLDHQPETGYSDSDDEVCANYAVNFVEAGSFELTVERASYTLSAESVFVSRPGAVHRYTHLERAPSDVCVSVVYSENFVTEIPAKEYFASRKVPVAIGPTNRLRFLKLSLAQLAGNGYSLALEDWACELISAIGAGLSNNNRLYRPRQLNWYAERVQTVRELFQSRYAEAHSLSSVASLVGMSPFQFSRVFSELAGLPPHRYLLRVRLDRARQMLLDGKSVTETCFDVGFSNLSHFTRSFRKRFGNVPSSLKSTRNQA